MDWILPGRWAPFVQFDPEDEHGFTVGVRLDNQPATITFYFIPDELRFGR